MAEGGQEASAQSRTGVAGFLALFRDGYARLRSSAPLRASVLGWSAAGLAFTLTTSLGLAVLHGGTEAGVALAAVLWWAFVVAVLVGGVPLLCTPEHGRVDRLGVPNGVTALRAWATLPLALDVILSLPGDDSLVIWCVGGGSVAVLDVIDGWLARRIGPITDLGRALDPAMDSLFFSVAAVGSVVVGIIPWWVSVLLLVRYLGPLLATPVVFLMRRRPELVHTTWGRRNTALVGMLFFTSMWVRLLHGPAFAVATTFAVVAILPTMVLHFVALGRRTAAAPVVQRG